MKKISYMVEEKGLEAHPDKTAYIFFKGDKRNVEKVEKELKKTPFKFSDSFVMTRRTEDRYLGQYLHEILSVLSILKEFRFFEKLFFFSLRFLKCSAFLIFFFYIFNNFPFFWCFY